jgi:hypothetical protein
VVPGLDSWTTGAAMFPVIILPAFHIFNHTASANSYISAILFQRSVLDINAPLDR